MFTKEGFTSGSVVKCLDASDVQEQLASPEILERLNKFANTVRSIAPKSDDFLYFTIIFLKAAEAALLDEYGEHKKIGADRAWGYFDAEWKWHGNVKPHKNNNGDIFPESELKVAARQWIGLPLCVDHKSDSVDGVRGIILDTYYDEKLKQVVGLCALDKVNYPELARKVETGVVRFGSMGTAVATSVCSDCGHRASTPQEYCSCITTRRAWGEINVGLKPIEYSLVVQPAEPGARLLRCIASIKHFDSELNNYGIDVDSLTSTLTVEKADKLDLLLNSVCGKEGCSIEERQRIVKGFLRTNGFMKSASLESKAVDSNKTEALAEVQRATGYTMKDVGYGPDEARRLYEEIFGDVEIGETPDEEIVNGRENAYHSESLVGETSGGVKDLTGTGTSGMIGSVSENRPDTFQGDGVGPDHYAFSQDDSNKSIKTIAEEIMKESRRRERAEMRRRIAYHFGGSEGVEPSTYKDEGANQEKIREHDDKQMQQTKSMGGTSGMFPGDEAIKQQQKRAKEKTQGTKKEAYHFGGAAPAVEPATFKSEDYHKYWDSDKHMHQTKSMGGTGGMFPGDESIKQHQKRAKYEGPALKTVFKQRRKLDGSIDKGASCLEVYAGDKLVIAATANNIFGRTLDENWEWITSKEYGKAVTASIRENGLEYVGRLLTKSGQEMAPPAPEPAAALAPEEPMDELPLPEETLEEMPEGEGEADPKSSLESALVEAQDALQKAQDALASLGGEDVNIDIDLNKEDGVETPELSLASDILTQLKTAISDGTESADELAKLSETYEGYSKLSTAQKKQLNFLAREALNDSMSIVGETKTLIRMANVLASSMVKTSQYVEEIVPSKPEVTSKVASEVNDSLVAAEIMAQAMEIRKQRRADLLKKAEEMWAADADEDAAEDGCASAKDEECASDKDESCAEDQANMAHDGIGMKENAPVAGVTSDTAESVATKSPSGGDHKPAPSRGNQDAHQFSDYPSTPSKSVAEKANPAEDGQVAAAEDQAEDAAEDQAEDAAEDQAVVQAKLASSFMQKKAEEEREAFRLKVRRAYDVAMEMQRKGLCAPTKPALDKQVDMILEFDDRAFEAFKNSIAMAQSAPQIKTASDIELNVGLVSDQEAVGKKPASTRVDADSLSKLWD